MNEQQGQEQEPHDNRTYHSLWLKGDSVKLFIDALNFYAGTLQKDIEKIKADPDLSSLIDIDEATSPIHRELERVQRATRWLDGQWDKNVNGRGAEVDISHGSIRFFKSVGRAYVVHLKERRNSIASRMASEAIISEVDRRLTRYAEMLEMGVFGPATPRPLLMMEIPPVQPEEHVQPSSRKSAPTPVVLATIEILDRELNSRCLELLAQFSQDSQDHRFDTVVVEATRILEDRLRNIAKLEPTLFGKDLMTAAFSGSNPRLVLSSNADEQKSAHLLYLGFFGFVRNPFHHRMVDGLAQQRILQIIGMVDYLLYLIETAQASS